MSASGGLDARAVAERLAQEGLTIPQPSAPAANYLPFIRSGSLLYVAGQTPVIGGKPQFRGIVGVGISIEEAQAAARLCALNVLAQVSVACSSDFARVRCLRIGGFVRCATDFNQQAVVMNGASDVLILALGERGRHVRTAVGTNALPRGVPVEVDAVFAIDE